MKLRSSFAPVIVTVLFLMSMVGMRADMQDEFEREQRPYIYKALSYAAPPAPGTDSLGIPGVFGYGAGALTSCNRDSVFIEQVTELSGDTSVVGTLANILLHHQHGDTLTIITWNVGGWSAPIDWSGVGGYEGELNCVYLAGHTAPGGGVGYHRFMMLKIQDDSRNFVVRGVTWAGDPRAASNPDGNPNMRISNAQDFIFTENTHLWAKEKHITISPTSVNDTIRNATFHRNLYAQAQEMEPTSIQQSMGDAGGSSSRITWARNLWHSNSYRTPNISGGQNVSLDASERLARMLGNVSYNNGRVGVVQVRAWMADVIDAYCKAGPMSNDGVPSGSDYAWCVTIPAQGSSNNADTLAELYVERLIGNKNRDTLATAAELWTDGGAKQEIACHYNECNSSGAGDVRVDLSPVYPAAVKRDTALTLPDLEFGRINPFSLKDELFGTASDSGQVGAFRRVQCDGTFTARPDSMLVALLEEARDSTGISAPVDSNYVAARKLYTKTTGSACTDSDGNKLPDAFENLYWSSTGQTLEGDPDGDGWSNAEEYVNGTDPRVYTSSTGVESSPTYWNGTDSVYVRRISMKDSVPFFGSTDTFKVPADATEIPEATAVTYPDTAVTTARGLHFTCTATSDGIIVMDSTTFVTEDSASVITGITSAELMTRQPPGCN